MHGKLLSEKQNPVNLNAHDVMLLNKIDLPKNNYEVFFLKLQLTDHNKILDENLYWLSNKPHSYEKLNELERVSVKTVINKSNEDHAVIKISNPKSETAFFIRLKIMNQKNELVLPSYFTDNFFTLLPGDEKQIDLDFTLNSNSLNHNELKLVVEGWNVLPEEIKF
jgi:hypothetical protein